MLAFGIERLCDVAFAGPGRDRRLVVVKVIVTRVDKNVVVRDLMMTLTQKMHKDHHGNVAGRGLMGDSTSGGLVGNFAGRVAVQCSRLSHLVVSYAYDFVLLVYFTLHLLLHFTCHCTGK